MNKFLLLLAIGLLPLTVVAQDACASLIPSALGAEVLKKFPGYRLPLKSDNLEEDSKYAFEYTGRTCLGLASDDFDGDG